LQIAHDGVRRADAVGIGTRLAHLAHRGFDARFGAGDEVRGFAPRIRHRGAAFGRHLGVQRRILLAHAPRFVFGSLGRRASRAEPVAFGFERRERRFEPSRCLAAHRLRFREQRRVEPETRRSGQRVAASRYAGLQPVERCALIAVERHAGVDDPGLAVSEELERRQMRGDERRAATLRETSQHDLGQRRPFVGIRAGHELVEER
jgi:hypothetical protein